MNSRLKRFKLLSVTALMGAFICATLSVTDDSIQSAAASSSSSTNQVFTEFESGQVRPLAMSSDKTRLFAVNTPDNALEIFRITARGLVLQDRVPVGLQPVAVAPRCDNEVWVVNHLSDSVSVVTLDGTPRVVQTLLVGDEPRDIVFAGSPSRAFITTAHRGQHRTDPSIADVPGAGDPQFSTPGVGRADVWVFDPAELGTAVGGRPLKIMTFFTDTPRALAVSPDQRTVYVAGFKSGNQTTVIHERLVCDGFDPNKACTTANGLTLPGGNPGPSTNFEGVTAPEVGLIVKFNNLTQQWEDELGRNWNSAVNFRLPDRDVFAVDANTLTQTESFAHVGTTLFNMVTNPATGQLYVSNIEAMNQNRFEGPGIFAGRTVQGHLAETRITVISDSSVTPRHLNKHLDYSKLAGSPGFDPTVKNHSLSMPLGMVVSRDGRKLFLAAFGSSKIGVFDTAALEHDTFNPQVDSANYISVSGGGPSGLALDEARGRLYVMTRFDNSVKVIDLASRREVSRLKLPNPEPASIVEGRPLLYDATRFSGNGESSCASCHIFGDTDDLAWDLGNPDETVTKNPMFVFFGFTITPGVIPQGIFTPLNGTGLVDDFHPMKGPMVTQTMRGLRNSGAMHWRGDRANGFFGLDPVDSNLSFNNFVVAFNGLIGSADRPSAAEMQKFTDFQLQVLPPPNPVRNIDNSLTPAQQRARDFYFGSRPAVGVIIPGIEGTAFNCNGCHTLDPAQGLFGTSRNGSFEMESQVIKVPQLRNIYTRVGMFGLPKIFQRDLPTQVFQGDQIRGFGFVHDGSNDTLFTFFNGVAFEPTPDVGFPPDNPDGARHDMEQFVLAFDTDVAPIVGQQVTLTRANRSSVGPRIDVMIERAEAPFVSKALGGAVKECDLVARVAIGGRQQSFLYDPASRKFVAPGGALRVPEIALRLLAAIPGHEVTYTCLPPGAGARTVFNPPSR
ncbi:MAG TPA: hypothetical protein VJ302_17190 [Blastocatellia bacterium]|nr:hypothetical protein [Blastocatellia bacterium]